MTSALYSERMSWRRRLVASLGLGAALMGSSLAVFAQAASAARPVAAKAVAEQGTPWNELKPAQQTTLKPLEREWRTISVAQKRKWLELCIRYPTLNPAEQARVQERMADWARLTPLQRGQARLNFQEAKQLPAQDRQERWNAYQALSPEQKQQLAARAAPASTVEAQRKSAAMPATSADKTTRQPPQTKSNIVPNPTFSAAPKAISPTVVQARPGATTTSITKRPMPPSHQQTGLPKIAATPEFVNKATLLPQRGPQGAATRSAAVPASAPVDPQ